MNLKYSINEDDKDRKLSDLLFHQNQFVSLRHINIICFTFYTSSQEFIRIFFERGQSELTSLPFAPFGGFHGAMSLLINYSSFIFETIKKYSLQHEIEKVRLTVQPEFYNTIDVRIQKNKLLESGFKVIQKSVIQYLTLEDNHFSSLLNKDKLRYLHKTKNTLFKQLGSEKLEVVYRFIKTGREKKGYQLSMSLNEVEKLQQSFPENVKLFGLFNVEDQLLACSIVLKISNQVLYDFHHEDDQTHRKLSPTVKLIEGLYQYAKSANYKILDLGGSMISNEVNLGLFQFKKSLGAKSAYKETFELDTKLM